MGQPDALRVLLGKTWAGTKRPGPGLAAVFLSHYRRNPLQLLGLIVIAMLAMMLWSGVSILTDQARASLARSQAAIEPQLTIQRRDSRPVTHEDFGQLRRAGLCVTPRLSITLATRPPLEMVGIDPFTLDCLQDGAGAERAAGSLSGFLQTELRGSAATLAQWRALAPAPQTTETLGPATPVSNPDLPDGLLLGDVGVVADYRHLGETRLTLLAPQTLTQSLPAPYRLQIRNYGIAAEELAESFLLNLEALGVLALLVAALLIRSVYVFGLSQRQQTLTLLRQLGITGQAISLYLGVELLLIAAAGGSLGLLLGTEVARLFADGVQATLSGLFSAGNGGGSWQPPTASTWLQSLLILLVVGAWACGDQLWRQRKDTPLSRVTDARPRLYSVAHTALALAGFTLVWRGDSLGLTFTGLGLALGGLALTLPGLLGGVLGFYQRNTRSPLLEWSLSEMRALAGTLALPLIALAFAIAAAIGVYTMVTSFEATFARWLDQRLQGDIYLQVADRPAALNTALNPAQTDPQQIALWSRQLQNLAPVSRVHPVLRSAGLANDRAVDVIAVDPDSALLASWRFLQAVSDPWAAIGQRQGVMINEQLARRQRLGLGDRFRLTLGDGAREVRVLAIYADYGRPTGEVLVPLGGLGAEIADGSLSFILSLSGAAPADWAKALESSGIDLPVSVRNQAEIRQLADRAFTRTFAITQALSGLTLMLSGTALALIGYVTFRIRQPLYTLVHVFGLPLTQVRRRLLAHATGLTLLLTLLAVPLGVFLSWVLVARINPLAFGWALPFDLYPLFWLWLVLAGSILGAAVGLAVGNPVRLVHLHRSLVLLPLLGLLGACSPTEDRARQDNGSSDNGFAALGTDSPGFAQPAPGMTIALPADLAAHPQFRLEWWYLTANLVAEDGRRFGVQWTLFRQSLTPAARESSGTAPDNPWRSDQVWMAHAALSSPENHHFAEKFARAGVGQAGVALAPFRAWLDDWQMTADPDHRVFQVQAGTADFGYDLALSRTAETVRHGDNGFSAKSADGRGSMYFSFADLRVSGTVRHNGETLDVQGQGWFDREWSSQLLRASQKGWDWFSLHLADGAKLMVFQLRGEQKFYSGTYVAPDGQVQALPTTAIELRPLKIRATETGRIPAIWQLQIESLGIDLRLQSWPGDYWNPGAFPYWEGPVDVSGSHQGRGYAELTGYDSP